MARIRTECTCGTWDWLHEPHCDRAPGCHAVHDEYADPEVDLTDDWEPTPADYAAAGLNAA
ncbi:hypothetical protein HCA61_22150 [Rhodococcus sp. HNM0563]|uniref:hypothetical protein n=1 Tax=Rhodococcus sp. HNM0563 TaxID=2716339 RepID=UPI00146D0486|nr:hypothetical protein [Rhodococcus sp. HNM0563]NLU64943.1 hypothetical protein [Rhodococcus sp. HNM0563]